MNNSLFPIVDPVMHEQRVVAAAMQNEGWTENMMAETSVSLAETSLSYGRDMKAMAQEMYDRAWLYKTSWERIHVPWFNTFHAYGEENMEYYMDEQWTAEDVLAHIEQGRKPYEFNLLAPYIDALRGEQIGRRNEWRAVEENMGSAAYAEIASFYLKWVQNSNDNQWQRTESDVFRDNAVRGMGVSSICLDPHDPFGSVKIQREYPPEFSWDIYSAKDGTIHDAQVLRRNYWVSRVPLASQFPEWAPEILSIAGKIMSTTGYSYNTPLKRPKVRSLASGNGYSTQFAAQVQIVYGGLVNVTEMYHRRYIHKWKVVDGNSSKTYYFDNEQDAIGAARELMQFWMQSEIQQAYGVTRPLVSHPMECDVPVVDQYFWAGDQLLRMTPSMNNRFPYEFFMDSYYDGNVVSKLARGKGRQRFYNRMVSLIDMMVGAVKGQSAINKAMLAEEMTVEAIQAAAVDPRNIWIVDNNKADFDVRTVFSTSPPPQISTLVQGLTSLLQNTIKETYGGGTTMGEADYSGQSGESQKVLSAIGTTTTASIFDNFNDFGRRNGEQALYLSQFIDPTVRMAVMDDDGGVEFKSFYDEGVKSTAELKYKVKIVEVQASPTEKAQRMRDLDTLAGQAPEIVPSLLPLKLKYAGIAYSDRQALMADIKQREDAQAQAVQAQSDRDYEIEDRKVTIQEGGLEVKIGLLQLAQKNPPKIQLTKKLGGGPIEDAALLEASGIDAHPTMTAADMALKMLMDQDQADMAQEHFNSIERRTGLHDIQAKLEERKIQMKARTGGSRQGSAKSAHGTTTPKDRSARARKKVGA